MGRISSAWKVLRGERLVATQIQAEWVEYQQIFQGQLEQLSAYLARSAKAERRRLRRLQEERDELSDQALQPDPLSRPAPPLSPHSSRKAELRRLVAARVGLAPPQSRNQQSPPVPSQSEKPQEEHP